MPLARAEAFGVSLPQPGRVLRDDLLIDGLRQRALLFEQILADLSGPRTILQRRLLPLQFVSEPTRRLQHRGEPGLRAYAADLVWCPDRVWRVVGDLVSGADNHSSACLLEAPALAGFLPALCRFLLGEPLRLASMPSRWLADAGALEEIVLDLHRWAIVDAFRRGSPATPLAGLTPGQRLALQDRVDADPARFAARMLVDVQSERVGLTRAEHGKWTVIAAIDS